ncbi:MAG: LysR family transcriptional regulator [Gammaproteobacteria bacterium]|nr:LysR family transcriptional regulator [Gammaproteobacteria bacterium]
MDRLAALEAFLRVAESASFAEAARWLQVAPSVVSKRVSDLERDLGVSLFRRTTRSVSLTDEGRRLQLHASAILTTLDQARRELGREAAEPRGRLRLAAPTSFGALVLAPVVCEFRAGYPQVEVELVLVDRPVHPAADGFDLVVDDTGRPADGVVARSLRPIARFAVASPGYLARHGSPRSPRELVGHDCIHYSELESGSRWPFRSRRGASLLARVRPVLTTNSGRVMLDAALAGQGIAVLPGFLVDAALARGDLLSVLDAWRVPPIAVVLAYARSAYTPLRVKLMRDFLLERLSDQVA